MASAPRFAVRTVAEGIATDGQAALMQALQCERGQRTLYGQPMQAPALKARARAQARQHA